MLCLIVHELQTRIREQYAALNYISLLFTPSVHRVNHLANSKITPYDCDKSIKSFR